MQELHTWATPTPHLTWRVDEARATLLLFLFPLPLVCLCAPPFFLSTSKQSLARLGAEVMGVDPSPENVAVASAHAQGDPLTRTIRYEATTAEELENQGAFLIC